MTRPEILSIVNHILDEIETEEECKEFQEQLLDWEATIMLRKTGELCRCVITKNNKTQVAMLPAEVVDFILLYNKKV